MARVTKRQLKEDKLISTAAKLSIFLSEHWRKIASVIVAIVVVFGAVFLSYNFINRRNERLARSFHEAEVLFDEAESASENEGESQSAIEKYEEARAKFQEISQKSGHVDTISRALFYSAKCSYRLGRYDEAISTFQKSLDRYPKSTLAAYVTKAIGQCYEQLGDDESLRKAIQQYDKLAKYPETYVTMEAFVDKGRCYEKLGQWDQAIASYTFITDSFKKNVELAIQARSKVLAQKANDVILKYESVLGKDRSDAQYVKFLDEARAFEIKGQWFEALKAHDKAIFSQKQYWSEKASGGYDRALQNAADALRDYEDSSANVIKNIRAGRKFEEQGDWSNAVTYYQFDTGVEFDFLPGPDLFEKAQFRIYWINAVEKS